MISWQQTTLFGLFGGFMGYLLSWLKQYLPNIETRDTLSFTVLAVMLCLGLLWKKRPLSWLFMSSTLLLSSFLTNAYWLSHEGYLRDIDIIRISYPLLPLLAVLTLIPYAQAWRSQTPHLSYNYLFINTFNNVLQIILVALFVGINQLLLIGSLYLLVALGFDQTDIFISEASDTIILSGLLTIGILFSRQFDETVFRLRNLLVTLLNWISIPVTLIVVVTTLSLPITHLSQQGHSISAMVALFVNIINLFLLNISTHNQEKSTAGWRNLQFSLQIFCAPLLAYYALHGLIIRIQAYGFTPDRILALVITLIILTYSLSYLYVRLKHIRWIHYIQRMNIVYTPLALLLIIMPFTPLLNITQLSATQQTQRLMDQQVHPEQFDFSYLRYQLGMPGFDAVTHLTTHIENTPSHPAYHQITQMMDNPDSFKVNPNPKNHLEIIPDKHLPKEIDNWQNSINPANCFIDEPCYLKMLDVDQDGHKEVVLFNFIQRGKAYHLNVSIYQLKNTTWAKVKTYAETLYVSKEELPKFIQALQQNQLKTLTPRYQDLQLNDIEIR